MSQLRQKVTVAKEFFDAWTKHLDGLYVLGYSLPSKQLVQFKADVEKLREYVKIASDHTFGEKKSDVAS